MRTRKQYLLTAWPPGWRVVFLEPIAFGRPNDFRAREEGNVTYVTLHDGHAKRDLGGQFNRIVQG